MRPAYRSGDPRPEALMRVLLSLMLLLAVGCQPSVIGPGGGAPSTPANLTYQLEPSGDPSRPLGILLIWDDVTDANLASYRVYSRSSSSGSYGLRGETSSNTFHDNGVPHLQYYVTAVKDRKSTRLNSSHSQISYAVFCLKKKKKNKTN